jgi:CRISPR-associated protein Csx14
MLAGIAQLWKSRRADVLRSPLDSLIPMGGSSFKFDARKAWTGIDAGYSPDEQKHAVAASPVLEILAALGFEHARAHELESDEVRYGAWLDLVPPVLARPALAGVRLGIPLRVFRFAFARPGKGNKLVTFAEEIRA